MIGFKSYLFCHPWTQTKYRNTFLIWNENKVSITYPELCDVIRSVTQLNSKWSFIVIQCTRQGRTETLNFPG